MLRLTDIWQCTKAILAGLSCFLMIGCVSDTQEYFGTGPINLTIEPADVTKGLFHRTETSISIFPEASRCNWVYRGTIFPAAAPQTFALPTGKRVSVHLYFTDYNSRGTEFSTISQILTVKPRVQYRISMSYAGKAPDFAITENGRLLDLPATVDDCGG